MRGIWLWCGCLLLAPAALSANALAEETTAIAPTFSIGIDTFGLPTSLTILTGEERREDLQLKEEARFLLITATRAFFKRELDEAMSRIEDGLKKGYYVMPQKRLMSRVHYMAGRIDSSLVAAQDIASDTDMVVEDQSRVEFLQAVDRYLKVSLETQPIAYSEAAIIHGDQKVLHRFITPVGMEADRFGRILQTSFGTNEVVVFSKGLEFNMKLSGISSPFDVAVDPDGSIYVTAFGADRVVRFKRDGSSLGSFGKKGRGPGEFFGPEGIAVSPDRYLFVVDAGNHRVQKFTLDGKFLMAFGSRGPNPGQFLSPRMLAIQATPGTDTYTVLVLSQEGHLLQRFDPYGNFIEAIPTGNLEAPRDFDWFGEQSLLICTARGELLVLEPGSDTLTPLLDDKGQILRVEGISGLSVDDEAGLIYACNQPASDLRVFRPATIADKTLLNVTGMTFEHYPFIGVTLQVTTGGGEPITGLSRRNFVIFEDNIHRVIPVSVRPLTQTGPLNLVVHLDPSSSMDRRAILVRTFLSDLSRNLPPNYVLSIRKGDSELLDPTDNPYLIRKSLNLIATPMPGSLVTNLYKSFETLKDAHGRRNILMVTARESDLTPDQFAPAFLHMVNHGISLFVLHLGDVQLPILKTLCRRTGGNFRTLNETSISDMAFELASSKTASYFLVYPSPYGELQPNVGVDVVLRLFYLSDAVADRIRYFAPVTRREVR